MKKSNKGLNFLKKIEKYADDAIVDLECLEGVCKNESKQIQRTISFIHNDVQNLRGLIWEQLKKYEPKKKKSKK